MPEKTKSKKSKKVPPAGGVPSEVGKKEEKTQKEAISKNYFEGVGRRKRAIARVRIFTCGPDQSIEMGNLSVNGKNYKEYFPTITLQKIVEDPFIKLKSINRFMGTVKANGGGINAQAEAVRHGASRALILFDINFRKKLKKSGYLKRDPREVERKKFGLKKARRAPQWSKR
jgi:small subunit ribosomal protein S9